MPTLVGLGGVGKNDMPYATSDGAMLWFVSTRDTSANALFVATRLDGGTFAPPQKITVTGHAIVYHLDHRQVARYRSVRSANIVEETRREKIVRCQHGLALLGAHESVKTLAAPEPKAIPPSQDPETVPELSAPLETVEPVPSHFRDKTVPRSMLSRIVHRSS